MPKREHSHEGVPVLLQLAAPVSRELQPCLDYKTIGAVLGISARRAEYEATLALGKLVYRMRKRVGLDNRV